MGKRGKGPKRGNINPKKRATAYDDVPNGEMMDDEIDAFHKQRDIVPLDINDDIGESDEEDEHPVFDLKDSNEGDSDDDEDTEDDSQLTGDAAKIARQAKYLRDKDGGIEDEMDDDAEDEDKERAVWGFNKGWYHGADNADYLKNSDDEDLADEEAEVLRLQMEKAKSLSMEDFGLEDVSQDEMDGEPTLEDILDKGKATSDGLADKEVHDDPGATYEEVKKDLNALSKEEQMDIVYSSAPELVGLLSELNDALEELENKVNPLLSMVKEEGETMTGGLHYMEVKQQLLLAYCQAISFYLLLKSEGKPVRDHPVIARIVEIRNLLDKIKELDENLPRELEDILSKKRQTKTEVKMLREDVALTSDCFVNNRNTISVGKQVAIPMPLEADQVVKVQAVQVVKANPTEDNESKGRTRKHLNDKVGLQSMEMLKVRAALEEKLKQKGIFSSNKSDGVQKHQPVNRQLETLEGGTPGKRNGNSPHSSKLSHLVISQVNKRKLVSGDDDLPRRDDIGERRRKHEFRVLAGAGIETVGDEPGTLERDGDIPVEEGDESESVDEFYEQVKQQREAKLAAKARKYERTLAVPYMPEENLVGGRRHITRQIEKNRGLTRSRKKLIKNPRKKYRIQAEKQTQRRKGQVRDLKRPTGPYGGEASGINAGVSRSIKL